MSALIQYIEILIPSYILSIFKFAFLSILIEIISCKIYDLIWMKKLSSLDTEIADKKLFYKHCKNVCISNADSEYLKNHNSFIIELIYFLFTTSIILIGMSLKKNSLIFLFFLIKTVRKLNILYKINNIALNKFHKYGLNEDEVYYELYLTCKDNFVKFFEVQEENIDAELLMLELKFRELIRRDNLNKDIIVNLINSEKITPNTINMINHEYSKLINK